MTRDRAHMLLLNVGHFLDHLAMLVFATVAALALNREWGMSYSDLVPYATPGFVAFGVFSLPAGWLADRWSREGMIAVYFIGLGAASILTGFARTPTEIAAGLFVVGVFAAIYHPVGLTLVYEAAERVAGRGATTALAINGVWGNLGVGSAALITGFAIDHGGWRAAFFLPGAVSLALGAVYLATMREAILAPRPRARPAARGEADDVERRALIRRVTAIVLSTTAISGLIFQSTTFALPKVLAERLTELAPSASALGWIAFLVFAVASLAQIVVGRSVDRFGARPVFVSVAALQAVAFAAMPGLAGWPALIVAQLFMLGAFGQIPINDTLIGRMATPERRASIYGARFVVTFVVLAAALPFIAWVHRAHGFDTLFRILALAAVLVAGFAALLPGVIPGPVRIPARASAKA